METRISQYPFSVYHGSHFRGSIRARSVSRQRRIPGTEGSRRTPVDVTWPSAPRFCPCHRREAVDSEPKVASPLRLPICCTPPAEQSQSQAIDGAGQERHRKKKGRGPKTIHEAARVGKIRQWRLVQRKDAQSDERAHHQAASSAAQDPVDPAHTRQARETFARFPGKQRQNARPSASRVDSVGKCEHEGGQDIGNPIPR